MPRFVKVAKVSEVAPGKAMLVIVEGRRIALFHVGEEFFALDDTCPHEGGPLSEGTIEEDEVECPWHAARFNLRTGKLCNPPAYEDVKSYPVRVSGDDVEVSLG